MATTKKQEVATANEQAGLPAGLDLSDIENDAGYGVDDMGMDDIAVPYLYILQTNSPQVDEDSEKHVEGAKSGMFFNNVSEEVFNGRDDGILVIPCAYERKYVEWLDRDNGGGGYIADHSIDSNILDETTPDDKGRPRLGNGNMIIETAYHYVYMQNPSNGIWEQIIIPMKSTALKKSRRWNKALTSTLIPGTGKKAPRWLYPYKLKTVKETKNDKTWSNFDIERMGEPVTKDQYLMAKAFAELFKAGEIKAAPETEPGADLGEGGNSTSQSSRSSSKPAMDEEIPF